MAVLKPSGLNKLILSDSYPTTEMWTEPVSQQLTKFPREVEKGMEAVFDDAPKYRSAMGVFFAVHGCTVKPWPKEMNASFGYLFEDPTVGM